MESLKKIKELVELMSVDTHKVFKGNHSASIRARQTAQAVKILLGDFRKDILTEIKTHDELRKKIKKEKKLVTDDKIN
jgi:hypothetical protein